MEVALGVLGWRPATFWDATYLEFSSAYAGFCRFHRIGPFERGSAQVGGRWTSKDVSEIKAFTAEMKERFPDGPLDKETRRKWKRKKVAND